MSVDHYVEVSVAAGVATIRLNRPERLNAISVEMGRRLFDLYEEIESDSSIQVSVLTGAGRAFCAGADLKDMATGNRSRPGSPGGFAGFVRRGRRKPVIAAVNGLAYGGGFEIVLACDLVIAAMEASFALPEVRRGIVAGGGGAIRLGRHVPPAVARGILLAGRSMDAVEARRWGLINDVVEQSELLNAAISLAQDVRLGAPQAVMATLSLSRASDELLDGAAWPINDATVMAVRLTEDAREGPRAYTEKRPPRWSGR